jgi:2-dehydro-3-deoxyphosphogalactonate aldolase
MTYKSNADGQRGHVLDRSPAGAGMPEKGKMNHESELTRHSPPIVAILRGVEPGNVVGIGQTLLDAGICIVEVPLNSPNALQSIERLATSLRSSALVGAGTVLTTRSVDDIAAAGGKFVVAPNTDTSVIARSLERGLEPMPGALTPTEALTAISAGARHLKVFPAGSVASTHIGALRDVIPSDCRIWAVGGVSAANLPAWIEAGAFGVGIGGSLYRPGRSLDDVRRRANELVAAWRDI